MLSLRSRKRRHSETLSVPEASKVVDEASSEDESDEELDTEDEEAIAKSVREEFFEGLDQLGHTARRKMSLIGEVDQNVTALTETIKSQLRLYYDIRRGSDSHSQAPATDPSMHPDKSSAAPMKSSDIIPRIACNMDEWVRSGEEKVNLAQTMQEAIERHIRLIDHAISEQENAISSQSSSGLYLPPIVMPDKWIRAQHTAVSPMSDDETPEAEIIDATATPLNPKALTSGRSGKAAQNEAPTLKFKLTLPVPQSADPNEPRYCICNEVSYGEMIGCDNMNCKIEWFHIRCVGLDEAPTSVKWYCNDCKGGRIFGGVNVNRKTNKKKRRVNEAYRA